MMKWLLARGRPCGTRMDWTRRQKASVSSGGRLELGAGILRTIVAFLVRGGDARPGRNGRRPAW